MDLEGLSIISVALVDVALGLLLLKHAPGQWKEALVSVALNLVTGLCQAVCTFGALFSEDRKKMWKQKKQFFYFLNHALLLCLATYTVATLYSKWVYHTQQVEVCKANTCNNLDQLVDQNCDGATISHIFACCGYSRH
eukprot:TRINITY_DN4156_c1_g1_i3.p1 TRINITY_DN4156_c1_g1~~TRINITY_DN4156_c1_g1_i3.p1  ORF type:complete len:138 (+),score=21.63 TRINITY_DN4156_c1_g1_i3:202-615(+)